MRKPDFCISENKDADQLCGTKQLISTSVFRYIDGIIPLLHKTKISRASSHLLYSTVCVGPGRKPQTGFLTMLLN